MGGLYLRLSRVVTRFIFGSLPSHLQGDFDPAGKSFLFTNLGCVFCTLVRLGCTGI